ncbi:MAG: DsrE/DsrF/DrsH-like family protein [Phycisphaerae bacterium]|nr:DsrE/DsrF/DrsH-like family protein [Phycisphaerae bacterium]MDD5381163.1 DsrE/DsrF/DrsH-like family protein [Phycisphaerae bacterium]
MNNRDTKEVSQSLLSYINETVDAKVSEKFDGLHSQIEQALRSCQHGEKQTSNRVTIVAFSGEMDKLLAAFIIATGAAAMGMEVSIYFTFWGLAALKKKTIFKGKSITEKLMGVMLPSGPSHLGTSKMNMLGMGPAFFKYIMKKKNIETLPGLIALAKDMGIRMIACEMSMEMMGISEDELIDDIDHGGVATYLADAGDSKITLFI